MIHVIATLSGCCASPVLVTLTHLSMGNGQVMRDRLVMSPNSYVLKSTCQNLTQNIRSLHVYFCFSKPWPQHQTIGGWRAARYWLKSSLSSTVHGQDRTCSVLYWVCHNSVFGAVKRGLVPAGDTGGEVSGAIIPPGGFVKSFLPVSGGS